MTAKILEALPVPILLAFILYAVFPKFETSIVVVAALAFIAVKSALAIKNEDRFKKVEDEMKSLKDKLEAIQLGKSFGR